MTEFNSERLNDIERRLDRATPGPWAWCGNVDTQTIYLATVKWGRQIVMSFQRWGMRRAQPEFVEGRVWVPGDDGEPDFRIGRNLGRPAKDLAIYEVARGATSRDDPNVYRGDLVGLRSADAELIAHARADLDWAVARIRQLEEQLAPFQAAPVREVAP
jgi:hypothetical protein